MTCRDSGAAPDGGNPRPPFPSSATREAIRSGPLTPARCAAAVKAAEAEMMQDLLWRAQWLEAIWQQLSTAEQAHCAAVQATLPPPNNTWVHAFAQLRSAQREG